MTRISTGWKSYAYACGLFALALSIRFLVLPVEGRLPFAVFYPGLVLCVLLFGWRQALLFIVLTAIAGTYFFVPPFFAFNIFSIVPAAIFIATALLVTLFITLGQRQTSAAPLLAEPGSWESPTPMRWLTVGSVMFCVVGALTVWQNTRQAQEEKAVARTQEVKSELAALLSDLTDAETGERGFILTGKEIFLEPYKGSRERVFGHFKLLRELSAEHGLQQERLNQIEPLLHARLDALDKYVALMRSGKFAEAQTEIALGGGKQLHDRIRDLLEQMRITALERQRVQSHAADINEQFAIAISVVSLLFGISALAFAIRQLMHELSMRRLAEDEVRRLNAALITRADDLEARLQLAARASNTGFWDWNLQTNAVYYSPEWKAQLGYADSELTNQFDEWESRVHPDDLAGCLQRVQTYIAAPVGEFETEFRLRHRDGGYRWILARGQVQLDANGKPFRMLGSHVDITERRQIEDVARRDRINSEALINSTRDLIWSVDRDLKLIAGNQSFLSATKEYSGLLLKCGDSVLREDVFTPELIAFWKDLYGQVLAGLPIQKEFFTAATERTSDSWLELNLNSIHEKDQITGVACFGKDVTERKNLEATLANSAREFRLLAESMPQIVWATRADGYNIYLNQQWVDYTGLTLEESGGHGWSKPIHPDDHQRTSEAWSDAVNNGGIYSLECRLRRADGIYRWWLIRGVPVLDEQGNITKWYGTCTDIEDIKRTEIELRDSEARYHGVVEAMAEGVSLLDRNAALVAWNKAAESILGLTGDQLRGISDYDPSWRIIHEDGSPFPPAEYPSFTVLRTGLPQYGIVMGIHKPNGVLTWISINAVPIFQPGEPSPSSAVTSYSDITERKQYEDALREKNTELERFTYMISHDLKSPLVTIRTFLSYLEQDMAKSDAGRIAKDMEFMGAAAEKMSRMLDELLEFSRVGRIKKPSVQISWRDVVDEALTLTAGAVSTRHVRLEISAAPITLCGERDRFVQIWQNLIDNAVKFMGEQPDPTIRLGAETKGKDVTFFVCDNGVGIDPRYHEKIFQLFEKLDAHIAGTGLGLALVKRVVESYGGTIRVESSGLGTGTCFRFSLPHALDNKKQESRT